MCVRGGVGSTGNEVPVHWDQAGEGRTTYLGPIAGGDEG